MSTSTPCAFLVASKNTRSYLLPYAISHPVRVTAEKQPYLSTTRRQIMVNSKRAGERLAKKLGANLAVRRKARKWSQEDLAERMGVATETISRFERGATLPSLVTLQRLGQVLRA